MEDFLEGSSDIGDKALDGDKEWYKKTNHIF
jgi:hypothetical protein